MPFKRYKAYPNSVYINFTTVQRNEETTMLTDGTCALLRATMGARR